MKNSFYAILLACVLCVNAAAEDYKLPSPTKEQFIYFTADQVTYDQNGGVAAMQGNVEIVINDGAAPKVIKGEDIQILTENKLLISKGKTIISGMGGTFEAYDINFDIPSRALIMKNVTADYSPVRIINAQEMSVKDGKYTLVKADMTCCNLEKPHYTLSLGKAVFKPGDIIYGTNAVVKFGKVPVFYLPFVYRSLNTERILTTYFDFTQSDNTGLGLLTSTVFSLGGFSAAANLDYYTKAGVGYGTEVSYNNPQKFRGSLQYYAINDRVQDKNRWGVDGGYWWEVYDSSDSLAKKDGALYFSQFETRNVSDADFNDDFFRSNPYVVSPDKLTRASVVRQSSATTLRASYSNRSQLNADDKTYSNAQEVLPKLELIFHPFAINNTGLINNVKFDFNSSRIGDYDFVQYGHGNWTTSKDFKLHRNFTLTPTAFYDQEIIFKDPTNNDEDTLVGRFGGQLNLRSDLITGMLDTGYKYTRRTVSGSLTSSSQNTNNSDAEEEYNLFYIQNYYMPTQNTYFKLATGYDASNSKEDWAFKYRAEPVTAEVGYFSPLTGTSFFLQNLYDVYNGNQAFVLDSTFKSLNGSYANLGIANYSTDRSSFLVTSKFMLAPKGFTWRADMGLDFEIDGSSSVSAYSKHIKVYKDFHDVTLMVGVRDRNQNLSFTLRINILCGAAPAQSKAQKEINQYRYPWRDDRMIRDNF